MLCGYTTDYSMSMKRKILERAVEHWHKNFTGVSALSIAEQLELEHSDVLAAFSELEDEGCARIREDVTLYSVSLDLSPDQSVSTGDFDWEPKNTAIIFPSREVLEENFYSSGLAREGLPEYTTRLHKGGSQIELVYFEVEVLKKYLQHPEKYDIGDSVSGGTLHLDYDYLSDLSEEEAESQMLGIVRFGKRRSKSGAILVTAILHDLAEMPSPEQRHWHSHEVEPTGFARGDTDFIRYFARTFEGEFVEYDDPIRKILDLVKKANEIVDDTPMFRHETNPYLAYPVSNTRKDFVDSCSELYKIVGVDSLNKEFLQLCLERTADYTDQDFVHDSGRPKSKLQLLQALDSELENPPGLADVIKQVRDHRISSAHRIIDPAVPQEDYLLAFRRLCTDICNRLKEFKTRLSAVLNEDAT